MSELKLPLIVDTTEFQEALQELARWFKSRDIFERLDSTLLDELHDCIFSGRVSELYELVAMPAAQANELRVRLKIRGSLERAITALRTLPTEVKVDDAHDLPS